MELFGEVLCYISTLFSLYAFVRAYKTISKNNFNFSLFSSVIFITSSFLVFCGNYILEVPIKVLCSIFVMSLTFKFLFRDNFLILLFKTIIIYLILLCCDFFASMLYLFFPLNSAVDLGKLTILKGLSTFLVSLVFILIFLLKPFVNFINKLIRYFSIKINYIIIILSMLTFALYFSLALLNATTFKIEIFLISILLMFFLLFLCIIMIFQYFKNKNNEAEQKSLLELMSEYEKILDKERMNRHEMLNNLVILKSFNNKSSLEFEDTLNDIINTYQGKKSELYSNLYKLPSGIKGIIYYKMARIKEYNINLKLLSSPDIDENFEKLNQKLYFKVCKILGIVLDNAIEAAFSTKDKLLLIDIYYDDALVIYIENSFSNNVELKDINEKGVSTKGNNRGYGLYIARKLLNDTDLLSFNQYIENNRFITVLKIKNSRYKF